MCPSSPGGVAVWKTPHSFTVLCIVKKSLLDSVAVALHFFYMIDTGVALVDTEVCLG